MSTGLNRRLETLDRDDVYFTGVFTVLVYFKDIHLDTNII